MRAIDCFVVESQFLQFLIPEGAWTKSHFPWVIFHLLLISAKLSPDFVKHIFVYPLKGLRNQDSLFLICTVICRRNRICLIAWHLVWDHLFMHSYPNINLRVEPGTPSYKEPKFIVFFSMLLSLFTMVCFKYKKSEPRATMKQWGPWLLFPSTVPPVVTTHFDGDHSHWSLGSIQLVTCYLALESLWLELPSAKYYW